MMLRLVVVATRSILLLCCCVEARVWHHYCDLSNQHSELIIQVPSTGEWVTARDVDGRWFNSSVFKGNETNAIGRRCLCAYSSDRLHVCPIEYHICAVPYRNSNVGVACFTSSSQLTIIRKVWPVCYVWIGVMFIFLLVTKTGRGNIHYLISCCYPPWQRRLANRIADHDPVRSRQLLRSYGRRRRAQLELRQHARGLDPTVDSIFPFMIPQYPAVVEGEDGDDEEVAPQQFALKTKTYHASPDDDDDDAEETSCTICFIPLVDGDRVGALPCDHVFHASCLKEWLSKRAVCPLCQRTDVLLPYNSRSAPTAENPVEANTSTANNNEQSETMDGSQRSNADVDNPRDNGGIWRADEGERTSDGVWIVAEEPRQNGVEG